MSDHKNILIIDDEDVVIDSIKKVLELEKLTSDSVHDAETGLRLASQIKYDLIICDIMLPAMDGFEFLLSLNSYKINTPVIMTTGYSTLENAVKSIYYGAINFIPKPFTIDEVISAVKRGMIYSKLKKENFTKNGAPLVTCPAPFYRLGCTSWIKNENDGTVKVGATSVYLETVEPIEKIDFLQNGDLLTQAVSMASFNSAEDVVHPLLSPISGRIVTINEKLLHDKLIIEKDPYFEGWIYSIIPNELDYELSQLIPCSSDRK
jgi:CheY-like chemotaxis protein